jgi:anti-sigma factor RsiW
MNHLTDETLNEYLDDALPPAARAEVDAHLRDCADCELRLDELADVFFALDSLPDLELARDLSGDVVRAVTAQSVTSLPRFLKWTAILQAAAALVAVIASLPLLQTMFAFDIPAVSLPTALDLLARFDQMALDIREFFARFQFQAPRLTLEFSSLYIAAAVFSVTLLWLVGNGLLLRPPHQIRSQGDHR